MESLQKDGSISVRTKQLLYVLGLIVVCIALWLFIKYVPGLFMQQKAPPGEILDFLKTSGKAEPAPQATVQYLKQGTTTVAAPPPPSVIHFLNK